MTHKPLSSRIAFLLTTLCLLAGPSEAKAEIMNVEFNQSNWMDISDCLAQVVQAFLPAGHTLGALPNGVVGRTPSTRHLMIFNARIFTGANFRSRIDARLLLFSTSGGWNKSSASGFPSPSTWSTRTRSMSNIAELVSRTGEHLLSVDVTSCWLAS